MDAFTRILARRREATAIIPHLREGFGSVTVFGSVLATRCSSSASPSPLPIELPRERKQRQRKVAVFWDLDNKPPTRVLPFEAAVRLKEMAGRFGEVVDIVAYANHHAFAHVPTWIHEERRQRKVLDLLEATGEVKPEQPYICGVCGARKKTRVQLTSHFKMLHEREQKKRMNHLDSLKTKTKQKARFLDNNSKKMVKYKMAARTIIPHKVGYGLMQDIRRAGVYVRTVKDLPQAADVALKEHMARCIKRGVDCICLVSDDTDFKPELRMARERQLHTVVVGDLKILGAYADTYFSWAEVASGRAEQKAKLINGQLVLGDISSSEVDGLTVRDYEPEDVVVEEESDGGSESDGGHRWRRIDRRLSEERDDGFDSFSDEFSESDSEGEEEAEQETKLVQKRARGRRRSQLQGGLTGSTFGINSREPPRRRSYTTTREIVDHEGACNRSSSTEEKVSQGMESKAPKPERLHHFFTMLESANKGHSTTIVTSSKSSNDAREEKDSQHFNRVQQILQTPASEKEEREKVDSQHLNRVQDIHQTPASEKEDNVSLRKDTGGVEDGDSQELNEDLSVASAFKEVEEGFFSDDEDEDIPRKSGKSGTGGQNKQQQRRRHKKTGPGKARIKMTASGPVKITRIGPRPFILSGFASEAQKDCDAVNKYYAEWWCDDRFIYRGRQDRRRKQ